MRKVLAPLALAAVVFIAVDASLAQRMPGRDRGDSPRDFQKRDRNDTKAAPGAAAWQDPFGALERELPSLKVDLRLTAEQVEPWSFFERDVKDLAQLERVRRRHLLALRDPEGRAPTALQLISTIAEEERQKAEAAADLKRHFATLYAAFDETQQRVVDRRIVLSQTEPLSQTPSASQR